MPDPKYNEPFKNSFIDKMSKKQDTTFYKNNNVDKAAKDMKSLSKTNPSSLTSYGREYGFKGPKGMEVTMVTDSVVAKYGPEQGSQGPENKVKKTYKPSFYSSVSEKPKNIKKDKPFFYKNQ
jgi:hypothetical protein